MHNIYTYSIAWLLAALLAAACGKSPQGVNNPKNSVYYWRTTLRLDSAERHFLSDAQVGKMYVHFFDVVKGDGLHPANTLLFEDSVPQGIEVIPTVFFEPDALKGLTDARELAQLVLNRIDQMTEQNGLAKTSQVQMDYDWVGSDETIYFNFLSELGKLLHKEGRTLSATIRLHQLAQKVPPVDEGVLMVYNVGNFRDEAEQNSILTTEALVPYLPKLKDYDLPLCTALPIYGWDLLYQNHSFRQIVRGVNLSDTLRFSQMDSTHYRCLAYMAAPADGIADPEGQRIYPGDIIRHEEPSTETLRQVRDMLERSRSGVCSQLVIYHLDSKFIKGKQYEIKELY